MEFNFDKNNFKASPFSDSSQDKTLFKGGFGKITVPEDFKTPTIKTQTLNKLNENEEEALGNCFMNLSEKVKPSKKTETFAPDFKRILKFKDEDIETFLAKYFPFVYQRYVVRKAVKKLVYLNKTANELVKKTTPFGETDNRYKTLAAFLGEANQIQAKLEKKIKKD